ncbi:hypothetical protein Cgig2_022874 [Carnegiea gigantea]|uniref:SWIM-type domain-containing protein n=1 Tax=Carnegiea gigantea TaxID=171969 RepID=A0A9Q1KQB1_9CARY|nr:hypothetical protein Cgig2_022874 [Carnegiea gigantea]
MMRHPRTGRHIKDDEHTDFKNLKWNVGITCETAQNFKDAIARYVIVKYAIAQGLTLKYTCLTQKEKWLGQFTKMATNERCMILGQGHNNLGYEAQKGEELKLLFWNATKSYNETDSKDALEASELESAKVVKDFVFQNPRLFCWAFIRVDSRCNVIVNNMNETCNAYVIHAICKHLINMLENIRMELIDRIVVKKVMMHNSDDDMRPIIRSKLEEEKEKTKNCFPLPSSNNVFKVKHKLDNFHVDLNTRPGHVGNET